MVCCIHMDLMPCWLGIVMQTEQVVLMIGKAPLVDASSWEPTLSRGLVRSRIVSLSTAETKYIAAGNSCSQLLWMKQILKEYNIKQDVMTLYCDNLSAINISKNHVQHSRTKHIDIRHHFIRDLVEDKVVTLEHVATEKQLADIFTKDLDASQFEKLRSALRICIYEEF